jgi:hypothetical protein
LRHETGAYLSGDVIGVTKLAELAFRMKIPLKLFCFGFALILANAARAESGK